MAKPITLSLIIPAYNEARHLEACLNAVARQTEKPDEVILVDNNSSDETVNIAQKYPFVRVIHENKQGVVHGRNAGFDAAGSDIIGRIDADTILPEGWVHYIKRFYGANDHADRAVTGGGYFYNVSFPPRTVGGWIHSQVALRFNRFIMGHYILWGSNMAITRKQWMAVRADTCTATDIHEDLDLAIHMHRAGYEITYRAGLKVGVAMKRVFDDWDHLHGNMMWWPRTLRRHGNKRWIFGWLGAYVLFGLSPVLKLANLPFRAIRTKN